MLEVFMQALGPIDTHPPNMYKDDYVVTLQQLTP